ncbi:MAG: hypothetical protein JXM69_16300 [Anaerolineae bacterium]|nr:hypothetical protein [Anaerolineae bacterium]
MSREDDIKKLISTHNKRLQELEQKKASYGISADPSIPIEIKDIEAETQILRIELELLRGNFDDTELRKISFFLLGRGTLQGDMVEDKVQYLTRAVAEGSKIETLTEYIREFRPTISPDSLEVRPTISPDNLKITSPQKSPTQIEFVNRVSEIQYITNPLCPPYLLMSAPGGYGKTKLLETLKFQFEQQGWLCISIKLNRKNTYSLQELTRIILREITDEISERQTIETPAQCGSAIATQILGRLGRDKSNCILLIDEAETLGVDIAKQLLDGIIPTLNNGLKVSASFETFRMIIAGRYIADWQRITHEIRPDLIPLGPFTFPVVQESVRCYAEKEEIIINAETRRGIASHLMYLTGGHPGCIARILKRYEPGVTADLFLLGEGGDNHYETVIRPVIEEIRNGIPRQLRKTFDTLSVVRYFNPRLLQYFAKTGLIVWSKSEHELSDQLTQTYLVTREKGFLQDGVIRRMLAIRLRRTNPKRFIRICEEAVAFYEESLQNPKVIRPDVIAVELLFQTLQLLSLEASGRKQKMFTRLSDILEMLTNVHDFDDIKQVFFDFLNKDWEFQFNFNYLLRDGTYDHEHPFTEFKQKIEDFR